MDSSQEGAMEGKGDIETGDAASELRKKTHEDCIKYSFVRMLQSNLQNKSKELEKKIKEDTPVKLETKEQNAKTDAPLEEKKPKTLFGKIMQLIQDLPNWLKIAIVGLAWIMYPLYQRLRKKEDEVQDSVQSLLQVVERVAEVTDKLAKVVAEALPSDNYLKGAAQTVSQIAQKIDKDSETAQAFVTMVDDLGDELDEYLNPLIQMGDNFVKDKKPTKENKVQPELSLDAKL